MDINYQTLRNTAQDDAAADPEFRGGSSRHPAFINGVDVETWLRKRCIDPVVPAASINSAALNIQPTNGVAGARMLRANRGIEGTRRFAVSGLPWVTGEFEIALPTATAEALLLSKTLLTRSLSIEKLGQSDPGARVAGLRNIGLPVLSWRVGSKRVVRQYSCYRLMCAIRDMGPTEPAIPTLADALLQRLPVWQQIHSVELARRHIGAQVNLRKQAEACLQTGA
jgi:hypothetical protein